MTGLSGAAQVAPFSGKRALHVGCGGDPLPEWLEGADETRLDIDEQWHPDVVASMTDMSQIGPFDVVLAQHCLEHLALHDVNSALAEFARVLDRGGFAFIVVPDLQGIEATDDVMFFAPSGPVTGFDMIYGHSGLTRTNPHMAHKSGFTAKTLERVMRPYFQNVKVSRIKYHNLIGVGIK